MNLYHVTQYVNRGFDTYDAAVVAAESEEEARKIHPSGYTWDDVQEAWVDRQMDRMEISGSWAHPDRVYVELLGTAVHGTEAGVVLASFREG